MSGFGLFNSIIMKELNLKKKNVQNCCKTGKAMQDGQSEKTPIGLAENIKKKGY